MSDLPIARHTSQPLGQGAQGIAEKVTGHGGESLVLKRLPHSSTAQARIDALVGLDLHSQNPFLAAPTHWSRNSNGEIEHIAPFAEGASLQDDTPRPLPELLEIALHATCQWQVLEDAGLAHGDIAPSNLLISPEGASHWIDFDGMRFPDPDIPAPETIGHRSMLAPELRNGVSSPDMLSDSFAMAVYLNWLLLSRHPVTGLADTPAETDQLMSASIWPERRRMIGADETPIEVLGSDLMTLFDRGFSAHREQRPNAQEWRIALTQALGNTWIHDCGGAFVGEKDAVLCCPYCQASGIKPARNFVAESVLNIDFVDLGIKTTLPLKAGQACILGRQTLSSLPRTVSGQHLRVLWSGNQLILDHIGRNPTLIEHHGDWCILESTQTPDTEPVILKLADHLCRLELRT